MKKTLLLTAALIGGIAFPTATMADTPNRVTMTFAEFAGASGCVIVDKGGYSNLATVDGGNCPASVTAAFSGTGSVLSAGPDGLIGTADDGRNKADN